MDPATFDSLKTQLKKPFFRDKKGALNSFLPNYYFTADQVAEIISVFPHASEKEEIIGLLGPKLLLMTGAEAKKIVAAFTFAGGKLKAVEIVASRINDPTGKYVVLEAIDFHFDKEKARKILDSAPPPSQPGGYPSQCQGQGYQLPPGQGYQPPPGQGYQPPPGQGYQPPPGQGYQPPPGQGYQPPPGQGYQPPPGQGYQPPPGQGYQPPPGQGYQPPPGQGYQPPPGQGYPTQQGYGPPPAGGYPSPAYPPSYPGQPPTGFPGVPPQGGPPYGGFP